MHDIVQTLSVVCQDVFGVSIAPVVIRTDEQFGDYATNVALQLSKQLDQNPRQIAETIVSNLQHPAIARAEVAGPGFINLFLTDQALVRLTAAYYLKPYEYTAVAETNNPNPFKAMHIGHAFNAILADTVANLLEIGGATVHRVSYHGDVGAHVGKSMWAILRWVDGKPEKLQSIEPGDRNRFMSERYAEGAAAYTKDEAAKIEIDHLAEQSFTLDDELYKQVYDTCKAWSFNGIDDVVSRLGNKPVEKRYLESEADTLGVSTVRQHVGEVFIESDGALVFPGEKYGSFNNVFVSSRGRGLYGARDLGLMQLKHHDFHPSKSYIVTAEEQKDYFKGVIKAAELCLPELAGVTVNITTGTVKLASGKMSSRSGQVLDINWLFDQITEAISARGGTITDEGIVGALRYEFLRVRIGNDVIFDVAEAVSLQGNSGPYLQYAYARARSVLSKSSVQSSTTLLNGGDELLLETGERSLLRKMSECNEVINRAVSELMPHHVCTYLYELAQGFNRFYEHNRVIDDPRQQLRLELVSLYADTLKRGLDLLSIPAPERM